MKTPRKLVDVIAGDHSLSRLLNRARELQTMTAALRERVGLAVGNNLQVAGLNDGVLVLIASSPAWVVRARYLVPEIVAWCREQPLFATVRAVEVHVERLGTAPRR